MAKNKNILIIGSGTFANNLKNSLKDYSNDLKFLGFVKKNKNAKYNENNLNKIDKKICLINGIGNFSKKNYSSIFDKYFKNNFKFISLKNKSAKIYDNVKIGKGSIISEYVLIKSEVKIGKLCLINSRAIVSHNTTIGDYSNISLGVIIAGNCKIGKNTMIGMGAKIINNRKIGNNVIVGAGTIVTKDIPSNSKAYGKPMKIINRNELK